jgi:hypothetical protein
MGFVFQRHLLFLVFVCVPSVFRGFHLVTGRIINDVGSLSLSLTSLVSFFVPLVNFDESFYLT